MKYLSIDIESTGLDMEKCDIIEFGAVLDDLSDPKPLDELKRFHTFCKQEHYNCETTALLMNIEIFKKINKKEEGFTYHSAHQVGKLFKEFLLKNGFVAEKDRVNINVAGKNFMGFDYPFLKLKTDFNKHISVSRRVLDPAILYFQQGDDHLPGLGECLRRAGMDPEVKHTAIDDSLDVIKLIRKKMLGI